VPRVLLFLLPLIVSIYAVVDCIQTDESEVRGLPKPFWVLIILFFPLAGAAAWFLAGRPRRSRPAGRAHGPAGFGARPSAQPPNPKRPLAPDDDPEFLNRLREQRLRKWEDDLARREREEREKRDQGSDGSGGPGSG
jgi:hypothetical protein